jgi:hypothetical protein
MTEHNTTADILPRDNEAYDEKKNKNKNKKQTTKHKNCREMYVPQSKLYLFCSRRGTLKNWFVPCAVICSTCSGQIRGARELCSACAIKNIT